MQKRSGFQCRLQWCNFGHPDVNRKPWTKEEDKMLIKLAKESGNTWDVIAQKLQVWLSLILVPVSPDDLKGISLDKKQYHPKWFEPRSIHVSVFGTV